MKIWNVSSMVIVQSCRPELKGILGKPSIVAELKTLKTLYEPVWMLLPIAKFFRFSSDDVY